jgi:hypothetical protein
MPNLIELRAAVLRFSIEARLFALPMTAPANRCSIAFGNFSMIHASGVAIACFIGVVGIRTGQPKSLSPKGGTAGDG